MKRVDRVLFRLMPDIVSKRVLEPACGCAEFSVAAATHAAEVVCFDLDDKRLDPTVRQTLKLRFEIMDATAMRFPDGSFDTVVLYNAIGHLAHIAEPVLWECLRVVNTTGVVWVVSSFRMDKAVIQETLLPLLDHMELSYSTQEDSVYKLAICCEKTGRREQALSVLKRAEGMDTDEMDRSLAMQLLSLVRYRVEHPDYLTQEDYGSLLLESFTRLRRELPSGFAIFHMPWVLEWYKATRQYKKACELLEDFPVKSV